MPDGAGDYLADLTTAPIFDDDLYLSEALGLSKSQNEDEVEAQLAIAARESGIEDPYRFLCPDVHEISTAMSTMTFSSVHRSSMSIRSRETQSTGITSHLSRNSKDHPYVEGSPGSRSLPLTRASVSSEDCNDAISSRFRPSIQHAASSSTVPGATSVFSASSSLSKSTSRKQKRSSGLGLFSMFRRDTSTCTSRSHHGYQPRPLTSKLECGHALSKYAIQVHIQEALDSKEQTVPSCCGKPLPRSVLEEVLSKEEVDIVSLTGPQSPTAVSLQDSGYSEDGMSSIELPRSWDVRSHPTGALRTAPTTPCRDTARKDERNFDQALANEAFKSLNSQQKEEFERVSLFESNQRKALTAYHQRSVAKLTSQLDCTKTEKTKQQSLELDRLDESQIVAEHDLRKAHAQETQNVATALKYMEAYCAGSHPANPDVTHIVTEEDRKKLARQHMTQQKLPAKHESAINVLRARQEKDVKIKLQKQQTELQQLDADYQREKRAEELLFIKDSGRLGALVEARRRRSIARWDLRFEIWRRDWEHQHGIALNGELPHAEWPEALEDAALKASSPLALYLQATV